jgi:DNA-binding LacI/PurR family transcriptional regulator
MTPSKSSQRERLVTQRDIAAHTGLDKATVSLALRRDPRITPATTARVLEAAAALGYTPGVHDAARRLALSKYGKRALNHAIAVLFPPHFYASNYFAQLNQGLMETLQDAGFAVVTYTGPDATTPMTLFECGTIDGLVLVHKSYECEDWLSRLRALSTFGDRPIVTWLSPGDGCHAIITDDAPGAYQATHHLLTLGHRRFLHMYQPGWGEVFAARYAGHCRALAEAGLDPAQATALYPVEYSFQLTPGQHLTELSPAQMAAHPFLRFLDAQPDATAILAENDAVAIQIWRLLRASGRRVPEDISLIGFDDVETMPDAVGRNLLTTVRVPLVEAGRQAAAHVLTALGGAPRNALPAPPLSTELVLRASTAPPARR